MHPTAFALGALLLAAPLPPTATAPGNPTSTSAAAARKPGAARCSASGLSSEPTPTQPPLPQPVESMRRRIVAAAVACDYVALAVLARENGSRFRFFSGPLVRSDDPAAYWRAREESGAPLLARMVKVLQLPYAQQQDRYLWPALSLHPFVTPEDLKVIGQLFPTDEIAAAIAEPYGARNYEGITLVILANGDWLEADPGMWSEYAWSKETRP